MSHQHNPHHHHHSHSHTHPHTHAHPKRTGLDGDEFARRTADAFLALLATHEPFSSSSSPVLDCLDFGAGAGAVTLPLATRVQSVAKILAIDALDWKVEQLRARVKAEDDARAAAVIEAAQVKLSVPEDLGDRRFDVIVSSLVMHHVEDLPAMCSTLAGLLKPGGRVFIFDMEKKAVTEDFFSTQGAHFHGLDAAEIKSHLERAGLVDAQVQSVVVRNVTPGATDGEEDYPFVLASGTKTNDKV